jgi:hypothetical protein
VEEFAEIRRVARVEGVSINALAKRFGVHHCAAGIGIGRTAGAEDSRAGSTEAGNGA